MADSAVARLRGILARDHDAATIDQLLTEVFAEQLSGCTIKAADRPIPYALTDPSEQSAAPVRPTPRLIRDLLEGAAGQANRCTEQTRLRNGTTVGCTKQDRHPSPWHRRGTHSWKVVFGDAHAPHIPGGPKANELGNLRTLARDWRTALQKIAQQCRTCCTSCDIAEAALAQHPATERP